MNKLLNKFLANRNSKLFQWAKFIKNKLPGAVSVLRLISTYRYRHEKINLSTVQYSTVQYSTVQYSVFTDIYNSNHWGSKESKSGPGSTLEATVVIRERLPAIIEKYAIKSMLDAPCGDYNWMKTVEKTCNYIGGDIVVDIIENNQKLYASEKVSFKLIDITKDILPMVDLIFCRDCLQHLSYANVCKALCNFKNSGSKYLLVTSYPKTWINHDIEDGGCRLLNLRKVPFGLPKPLLKIKESYNSGNVIDKAMYLYKLNDLMVKK
jgi:hypothetical protein